MTSFAPGAQMRGRIKPTTADAEVAKMQETYTGAPVVFYVEAIEPMSILSFRWHPFAIDNTVDYVHPRHARTALWLKLARLGGHFRLSRERSTQWQRGILAPTLWSSGRT